MKLKSKQPVWLNVVSYIGVYAIAIAMFIFFVRKDTFQEYIAGNPYLVWTTMILPWIIIIANTLHLLDHTGVFSARKLFKRK